MTVVQLSAYRSESRKRIGQSDSESKVSIRNPNSESIPKVITPRGMRPKTYKTNRAPPKRVGSQYERYPLPFFNAKAHSTWHIEPIGDFKTDRETGRRYAIEFLQSCDGTVGWVTLLPQIVSDMVCAGASGTYADGHPKVNNVVFGFMAVISRAMCMLCMMTTPAEIAVLMEER